MSNLYIAMKRTDIPNGTLQIRDLWPNPSQYSPVTDPLPQGPFYLSNVSNSSVSVVVNGEVRTLKKESTGLTAYLLATMNGASNGAGGFNSLTQAQAVSIADGLLARLHAGQALAIANIIAVGDAVVSGSAGVVTAGRSTIVVSNLLAILTGAIFTLPAGLQIQEAGAGTGVKTLLATGDQAQYFVGDTHQRLVTSDLAVSSAEGALSVMLSDAFTYKGVQSQAVVIYNADGTLYDPNV